MSANSTTSVLASSEIEQAFDRELRFRPLPDGLQHAVVALLVLMTAYHFYAAGFGNIRELWHRGIHLSFVLGLGFVLFSATARRGRGAWLLVDLAAAALAVAAALYLPSLSPEALADRVGNPNTQDVVAGTLLIALTLEATRRSVGVTLPIIALVFVAFALYGPLAPGALKHGGTSWLGLVNHLYMTN